MLSCLAAEHGLVLHGKPREWTPLDGLYFQVRMLRHLLELSLT